MRSWSLLAPIVASGLLLSTHAPGAPETGAPAEARPRSAPSVAAKPTAPGPVAVSAVDASTVRTLQTMFDTHVPTAPAAPDADRRASYRAFARAALREPSFYDAVMPRLLRGTASRPAAFPFVLRSKRVANTDVFWLRQDGEEPCALKDTVEVQPWWNTRERVRVCKTSYAPDVKVDPRSKGRQYCEATYNQNPGASPCRCGEHLVNCARDDAQAEAMQRSIQQESLRTIEHIVQSNRPFSDVLTTNETVRSSLADFVYQRARFLETGKADFAPIPTADAPTLRPREARYGGGLITMPEYRWADPAPRILVSVLWEDFLCVPLASRNVDGHVLMQMTNSSLRSKDHIELTTMPGCRDCHARLEYALRAFRAFSTTRDGWRLYPPNHPENNAPANELARLYMWNADDLRGEGSPDPAWLGKSIAAQPEFASCMVDRVSKYVFREPVPAGVREKAVAKFKADQSFGSLFEDMVVARYGERTP